MKAKNYLWLLIPIGIISLIVLSILFAVPEKPIYDSERRQIIEQTPDCGPGGSPC